MQEVVLETALVFSLMTILYLMGRKGVPSRLHVQMFLRRSSVLLLFSVAFFAMREVTPNLMPGLVPFCDSVQSAFVANALIWTFGVLALCLLTLWSLSPVCARKRICAFLTVIIYTGVGCFTVANAITSPNRTEWTATLNTPKQKIEQQIELPANAWNHQAATYILFDGQWSGDKPDLVVKVNGTIIDQTPHPWSEFKDSECRRDAGAPGSANGAPASSRHSGARASSPHSHWWAVPVPASLFAAGTLNTIEFICNNPGQTIKGDFVLESDPTFVRFLPALTSNNITVYATVCGRWHNGKNIRTNDLSPALGVQTGEYRIRLAQAHRDSQTATKAIPHSVALNANKWTVF